MEDKENKLEKEKISLESSMDKIEDRIMSETNVDELNDIINIFNLNMQKKNILRLHKLNNLQDLLTDQMKQRIIQKADEFNNKDLLDYFKVIQETINKTDNSLDSIDAPSIKLTQNQLNINVTEHELDKDSRERIMDTVKSILNKIENKEVEEHNILYQDLDKEDIRE